MDNYGTHRMVRSISALVLLSAVVFFSPAAQADRITVLDMTIPCPGCIDHGNGYCESGKDDARILRRCEVLFSELAAKAARSESQASVLKPQDVLSALVRKRVRPPLDKALLNILFATPLGEKLVVQHFTSLLRTHKELLIESIADGRLADDAAQRIWHSYFLMLVHRTDVLQAFLNGSVNLTPESVAEKLERVGSEKIPGVARSILKAMPDSYAELARSLESTADAIEWCSEIRMGFVPQGCSADSELPIALQSLIKKIKSESIEQAVSSDAGMDKLASLRMLSEMDYASFRSYTTHDLVMGILKDSIKKRDLDWALEAGVDVLVMLKMFADNDSQIRAAGSELAGLLTAEAAPSNQAEKAREFEAVFSQSKGRGTIDISRVFLYLAAGFALIGLGGAAAARRKSSLKARLERKLKAEAVREALTQHDGRVELSSLMEYFNLNPGADEHQLRREYARRATLLPTNTGTGENPEFVELHARYERARKLINER